MSNTVHKVSGKLIFGACAVVAAGVVLNPLAWEFRKLELSDYLALLSMLFFVALVLERALEVYVRALYAEESERLQSEINRQQDALDFADKQRKQAVDLETAEINFNTELMTRIASLRNGGGAEVAQELAACRANIEKAREERKIQINRINLEAEKPFKDHNAVHQQLMRHKTETRIAALTWSTLTGLVLGAIGFRSLTAVLEPQFVAGLPPMQHELVTMMDIVLTGGLLAGGSEGIHKLMQTVTTFLDASTSGNKERTRR